MRLLPDKLIHEMRSGTVQQPKSREITSGTQMFNKPNSVILGSNESAHGENGSDRLKKVFRFWKVMKQPSI